MTAFKNSYAYVIVAIVFAALMVSAGIRATPGVLLLPLEKTFGWSRDTISFSAATGIFLYGLVGPFAAGLMQSFGIRRTVLAALIMMSLAVTASTFMTQPWHLFVTWGVLTGLGSGCVALVFAATIVSRWFVANRGFIMGLLTASVATGNLIFLPGEAAIIAAHNWRAAAWVVAVCLAALIPIIYWFLPERPEAVGLTPFGAGSNYMPVMPDSKTINPFARAIQVLVGAIPRTEFWLLSFTFFVCGFTTNGLIGTHLIAMCGDRGLQETRAAGLLATMGIFDLVGTTLSGWLTDRYDARKLLFIYYAVRGASLFILPYSDFSINQLMLFSVFYGLDWVATVPPTLKLTRQIFGEKDAPIVFGWILVGHQTGAAVAAFLGGYLRVLRGSYVEAFMLAGVLGVAAAIAALVLKNTQPEIKMVQ